MSIHRPSDGIAEEVERMIQRAPSAAALAARKLIEGRRAALAEAQARSAGQAAQMRAQLERERDLARTRMAAVHDEQWWEQTQLQDVASMSQTIEEWRDPSVNPDTTDFDHAHDRMEREVSERWGLSRDEVAALGAVDDLAAAHDQTHTATVADTAQAQPVAEAAARDQLADRAPVRSRARTSTRAHAHPLNP